MCAVLLLCCSRWGFDIFELDKVSEGRPLQTLGWVLLKKDYQLASHFGISLTKLATFLKVMEDSYKDNPYHNKIHAADVLQTVHYMLKCKGMDNMFADAEILALLLAAIVHDVEHDGFNNDFHKASLSELALLHNNHSVLENHHVSR